jgi:hypothetical protein
MWTVKLFRWRKFQNGSCPQRGRAGPGRPRQTDGVEKLLREAAGAERVRRAYEYIDAAQMQGEIAPMKGPRREKYRLL